MRERQEHVRVRVGFLGDGTTEAKQEVNMRRISLFKYGSYYTLGADIDFDHNQSACHWGKAKYGGVGGGISAHCGTALVGPFFGDFKFCKQEQ